MSENPSNQDRPQATSYEKVSVNDHCDNCGQTLGKLEPPMAWHLTHLVCASCHQRLSANEKPTDIKASSYFLLFGISLGAIAFLLFISNQKDIGFIIGILSACLIGCGVFVKLVSIGVREANRK